MHKQNQSLETCKLPHHSEQPLDDTTENVSKTIEMVKSASSVNREPKNKRKQTTECPDLRLITLKNEMVNVCFEPKLKRNKAVKTYKPKQSQAKVDSEVNFSKVQLSKTDAEKKSIKQSTPVLKENELDKETKTLDTEFNVAKVTELMQKTEEYSSEINIPNFIKEQDKSSTPINFQTTAQENARSKRKRKQVDYVALADCTVPDEKEIPKSRSHKNCTPSTENDKSVADNTFASNFTILVEVEGQSKQQQAQEKNETPSPSKSPINKRRRGKQKAISTKLNGESSSSPNKPECELKNKPKKSAERTEKMLVSLFDGFKNSSARSTNTTHINATDEITLMDDGVDLKETSDATDNEKNYEAPSDGQPTVAKKRGRKKKTPSVRTRKTIEDLKGEPIIYDDNASLVTCAVCHVEVARPKWGYHKLRFHNNLAWRVDETPIDLDDRLVVMRILTAIYKSKKPLYCEICGEPKKSVLGYLSHKTQCGKSKDELADLQVKCELCGSSMLPVSMSMHMKLSHSTKPKEEQRKKPKIEIEESGIKSERKAAKAARNIIHTIAEAGSLVDASTADDKSPNYLRFISTKIGCVDSIVARRVYSKELQENKVLKCKLADCDYHTDDTSSFIGHLMNCTKKPSNIYICRLCILFYNTEEEALKHFTDHHGKKPADELMFNQESDDDNEDEVMLQNEYQSFKEDLKKRQKKGANVTQKVYPKFLFKYRVQKSSNPVFPPAYKWTLEFCENNYLCLNLFENMSVLSSNWMEINAEELDTYSPELSHSIDVAQRSVTHYENVLDREYTWKKYELFESDILDDGSITLFCGGPISSLAWVPTPFTLKDEDQILAVSILLNTDKVYSINHNSTDAGLIQFWNFGPLTNKKVSAHRKPQLEFCICHNYGQILQMEWCPSGCYDVEKVPGKLKRLGLLAVAGSDPYVYIYSVPQPGEIEIKLSKPCPYLKLCVQISSDYRMAGLEYSPTKISWTKAAGHRYIAVGYSNGTVALYDLNTAADFLHFTEGNVKCILPIKSFHCDVHAITVLQLYHLNGGGKWLLTGSLDRVSKIWDLDNLTTPVWSVRKYIPTDGVWMSHWIASLLAFDDTTVLAKVPTLLSQLRDYNTQMGTILYANATVTSISGSDWLNGIVQANCIGEIFASLPNQLFISIDSGKTIKNKRLMFSYTGLIEKKLSMQERQELHYKKEEAMHNKLQKLDKLVLSEEEEEQGDYSLDALNPHYYCYEPLTYEEAEDKYGLVFCDVKVRWNDPKIISELAPASEEMGLQYPNMYPLQSIKQISFNPNRQSYLYHASGYQAGFVRLLCFKFLKESNSHS